jgi:uncharacterized damage-inducible protein DinB
MIDSQTIAEFLTYADWGREQLTGLAAELSDEQLDRQFEIGLGSLRATLKHNYLAELLWAQRLGVPGWQELPPADRLAAPADIAANNRALAAACGTWFRALPADALRRSVAYVDLAGNSQTHTVGDALFGMCNHGVHHRTQALNMLRQLGRTLPRPGIDYILMRLHSQAEPPLPSVAALRRLFAYGDWATCRLFVAAESLAGEQLDRPFEMGLGTLRATLRHICDAEQWWFGNWTGGPELFPAPAERPDVAEIRARFADTARRRNEFLGGLSGVDELRRVVAARPRPDVSVTFPLSVTMLQLCVHGTHHRAQAVNMLRRLDRPGPGVGYLTFARETPA